MKKDAYKSAPKGQDMVLDHTRRELKLAGAFDVESGKLGKAVLSVMKTLQHYAKEDQSFREAIGSAVDILTKGGLLSDPTNDPAEWKELLERPGTWSNRRNPFFVSSDGGQNWHHILSKQEGKSKDVHAQETTGSGTPGTDAADSSGASPTGNRSTQAGRSPAILGEAEGVEMGQQHPRVEPQSDKNPGGQKTPPAKPADGEGT